MITLGAHEKFLGIKFDFLQSSNKVFVTKTSLKLKPHSYLLKSGFCRAMGFLVP